MHVSVILTTFNRPALLQQTLHSMCELEAGGLEYEIVVVDNAGDQATARVVRDVSDRIPVRCVVETTRGQNNARNRVIPEVRGELVAFTDDDVIVTRRWLRELWAGSQRWPRDPVFGGRVLPKWPNGKAFEVDSRFMLGAYVIADWGVEEGPYWAWKVFSPNMAIRASVFAGGVRFDPEIGPNGTDNYVMGSESELTTRLENQGLRAIYLPQSLVYHQIRPEQMDPKWLYGRAFRSGRAAAYRDPSPDVPKICGVPRYTVRRLCEAFVRCQWSVLSRNWKARFDSGVAYWYARGLIHQYRKQRKSTTISSAWRGGASQTRAS